jgi:cobalamin biosynthesis Mg chelatase CobN
VHSRLASAREETQRTIAAEAEETERLRLELVETRDDTERELAAERAEVARLREELIGRTQEAEGGEAADATRRMIERVSRDLDRERAKSRLLQRELEALRAHAADARRTSSAAAANGTATAEESAEDPARPVRAIATPAGTRRRVDAARPAAAARVPKSRPSPVSMWAVRIVAALVVAALGVILVILVSLVT